MSSVHSQKLHNFTKLLYGLSENLGEPMEYVGLPVVTSLERVCWHGRSKQHLSSIKDYLMAVWLGQTKNAQTINNSYHQC